MPFDINYKVPYPKAHRSEHKDEYFGTIVDDPYHYMEDPNNKETKTFVEENNKLVENFLDKKILENYRNSLEKYIKYVSYGLPIKREKTYYYIKNDGEEPQGRFYSKNGVDSEEKEIIDFNTLSEDGTTSVITKEISNDGSTLAISISKHGSDWQEIQLYALPDGKQLDDVIKWVTFPMIQFSPDDEGFYYKGFPDQSNLPESQKRKFEKVFYHKLGTKQEEDQLIFDPKDAFFGGSPKIYEDKEWLFIYSTNSTMPENKLFYKRINSSDAFKAIVPELDGFSYQIIGIINNQAYCLTTRNAPNKKIVKIDLENPGKSNWTEIISESENSIDGAFFANNSLLVCYMENVRHKISQFNLNGKFINDIELSGIGSLRGREKSILPIECSLKSNEMLFQFESFFMPPTIFRYEFETKTLTELFGKILDVDYSNYEIKQHFYSSKDGTKVPMFILAPKNLKLDGKNKTILYGYGGFSISLSPEYRPRFLSWLDNGGIYVIVNLRGGSEFGEKWHLQGILDKKQNVFDDFIAAAEWLIKNKYTNTRLLAINGRSNGGLLAGACLVQRPDLFGISVPEVGVLDMLRFKHFQAGRFWTAEYGDAEKNEEHFRFLIKYSPVHNTHLNSHYPPTLVVAAESDDRVVPMHTKKFTAALQYNQKANNPIFMRIETKAGHGFGKSLEQMVNDHAYVLAIVDQVFNLNNSKL